MKRLLVVAHDPSPNIRRMVRAVLGGADDEEIRCVDARHLRPLDAVADDVLAADAVIFGTPENLGYMSGALKDFFDRCWPISTSTASDRGRARRPRRCARLN